MKAIFNRLSLFSVLVGFLLSMAAPAMAQQELITNGGFETGALYPWYGNGWYMRSNHSHTGLYSAYTANVGPSAELRQDFAPTPTVSILSITFWIKRYDPEVIWVHFFYDNSTYSSYTLWLNTAIMYENGFGLYDLTNGPVPGTILTGIEITGGNGYDSDLWLDDVSILAGPPPPHLEVTVTPVNPPIVIPATGGFFDFIATLTNNETVPANFDAWTAVLMPNGFWENPIFGPYDVTLAGGATVSRQITQYVPLFAPAGLYTYEVRVGSAPNLVWGYDNFEFTKEQGIIGDAIVDPQQVGSGWNIYGESFNPWLSESIIKVPAMSTLHNAYPNPFNPAAVISYRLSAVRFVNLSVYDLSGRRVAELVNGWRSKGVHEVTFDGSGLASGVYIYRLNAGDFSSSGKMVLMK
jgi:hypothetical protein